MTYTQQRELRENDLKNDKRTLLIKEEEPRRTKLCRIGQARTLKTKYSYIWAMANEIKQNKKKTNFS